MILFFISKGGEMGRNARKEDQNEQSWTTEVHKRITIRKNEETRHYLYESIINLYQCKLVENKILII